MTSAREGLPSIGARPNRKLLLRSPPAPCGRSCIRLGSPPAPRRTSTTWASFLHFQARALLTCDFFETVILGGARQRVLAVLGHASRRIRILVQVLIPAVPGSRMPRGTSS